MVSEDFCGRHPELPKTLPKEECFAPIFVVVIMAELGVAPTFSISYGSAEVLHAQSYNTNDSWKILLTKTNWFFHAKS